MRLTPFIFFSPFVDLTQPKDYRQREPVGEGAGWGDLAGEEAWRRGTLSKGGGCWISHREQGTGSTGPQSQASLRVRSSNATPVS